MNLRKTRTGGCRRGPAQLILAGQMNHIVGEVEFHSIQREVSKRDLLCVDWVPIAIVTKHGRATVRVNFQVPDLEFLAGNSGVMLLGNCDDVEQPESATLVRKELCAVGVQDCAIDAMAIPVLGACELAELNFGERCCVGHVMPLFLEVAPTAGQERHKMLPSIAQQS